MAERTIQLVVAASTDGSMDRVFKSPVATAKNAAAQISKEFAKSNAERDKLMARSTTVASKANAQIASIFRKREEDMTKAAQRQSQDRTRAAMREFDEKLRASKREANERAKLRKQEEREEKASMDRNVREAETANKKKQRDAVRAKQEEIRGMVRLGAETVHSVAAIGHRALSLGADIARGAGVDFDIGSNVGKVVNTQRTIIDAVNSGMIAKGKDATQADVKSAQTAVQSAGDSSRINYGSMADALKIYVERTGELEEGKQMLATMGDIAQATGSRIEDVAAAAGSMSKSLGDVPDKGKKVAELLRVISAEGAAGSVEIRQLASEMPKIASKAFMFDGAREKTIGQLGALAQFAIVGGAKNAAEATTSVSAFADTFAKMKGKKQKQLMDEYGIDIAAKRNERGEVMKYKSPEELVLETIGKTGGSPEALAKVFGNVRAGRAEAGLAQVYEEAGGGDAGLAAVKKKFDEMSRGMTEDQVKAAADLAKSSDAAKVEQFNNNLQKIAQELVTNVLPQMEKLAPKFLELAEALSKAITWAANNPGEAIAVAIVGSITKAAIGETVASALKSTIAGAGGANGGGIFTGAKVGLNAQTVTAVIGSFAAGYGVGEKIAGDIEEGKQRGNKVSGAIANAELAGEGTYTSQAQLNAALADAEKQKAGVMARISAAEDMSTGKQVALGALGMFGGVGALVGSGATGSDQSAALRDRAELGQLKATLASLNDSIGKLHNMKVDVHVDVNAPNGRPSVDQGARTSGVGQ